MKKAAVFGCQGQLGSELVDAFTARSYEVASFDRASVDISDAAAVEAAIARYHPDVVLNAAAYNQVDKAESEAEAAMAVNALAVRNLAISSRNAGALLVHYSTDYVFDGATDKAYREEDATHPLSAYAVSKLTGEFFARAYLERALVIRTCGVFGPAQQQKHGNFVETMLRLAASGQPLKVVDSVASPTYAPALAVRTADLVEMSATGIFHVGGGTAISWHDWAAKIFEAAGLQPSLRPVDPDELRSPARRPRYSALSNQKMESLGVLPMPPLEHALREYFEKRPVPAEPSSN